MPSARAVSCTAAGLAARAQRTLDNQAAGVGSNRSVRQRHRGAPLAVDTGVERRRISVQSLIVDLGNRVRIARAKHLAHGYFAVHQVRDPTLSPLPDLLRLPQIVGAGGLSTSGPRRLNCWQQQGRQNPNDGDDNQHLNPVESSTVNGPLDVVTVTGTGARITGNIEIGTASASENRITEVGLGDRLLGLP